MPRQRTPPPAPEPARETWEQEKEITDKYGSWTVEAIGTKNPLWYARLLDPLWAVFGSSPAGAMVHQPAAAVDYTREASVRKLHALLFNPAHRVILTHGDPPAAEAKQ